MIPRDIFIHQTYLSHSLRLIVPRKWQFSCIRFWYQYANAGKIPRGLANSYFRRNGRW